MNYGRSMRRWFPYLQQTGSLNWNRGTSNAAAKDDAGKLAEVLQEPQKDLSLSQYNMEKVVDLLDKAATFVDTKDQNWMTTPYPRDVQLKTDEKKKPSIDPQSTSVLLFPGQGTIKVGMVKKYLEFEDAKDLFHLANEIINYDLLKLCLNGPQEKLNRTEFNQVATVVSSLAALEKIRVQKPKVFESCVATAGYSVGEITALILSGAISFEDGVRLVWARGKAMQQAADRVPQGMLSIFCTPRAQVATACAEAVKWAINIGVENPVCRVAIYLHTQRKIVAGNMETLKFLEEHQEKYGLTNVTKLPVSGAFHTPLMEPALKSVFKTLTPIEVNEPRCKVYSNYTGEPYSNLRFMKKFVLKQIVSPVKWEQCLQSIYSRPEGKAFPQTYDVGSAGRMKTILKLINAKASNFCTVV